MPEAVRVFACHSSRMRRSNAGRMHRARRVEDIPRSKQYNRLVRSDAPRPGASQHSALAQALAPSPLVHAARRPTAGLREAPPELPPPGFPRASGINPPTNKPGQEPPTRASALATTPALALHHARSTGCALIRLPGPPGKAHPAGRSQAGPTQTSIRRIRGLEKPLSELAGEVWPAEAWRSGASWCISASFACAGRDLTAGLTQTTISRQTIRTSWSSILRTY